MSINFHTSKLISFWNSLQWKDKHGSRLCNTRNFHLHFMNFDMWSNLSLICFHWNSFVINNNNDCPTYFWYYQNIWSNFDIASSIKGRWSGKSWNCSASSYEYQQNNFLSKHFGDSFGSWSNVCFPSFRCTFQRSQENMKFSCFYFPREKPQSGRKIEKNGAWSRFSYSWKNIFQALSKYLTCKFTLVCFDAINLIFHLLSLLRLLQGENGLLKHKK